MKVWVRWVVAMVERGPADNRIVYEVCFPLNRDLRQIDVVAIFVIILFQEPPKAQFVSLDLRVDDRAAHFFGKST